MESAVTGKLFPGACQEYIEVIPVSQTARAARHTWCEERKHLQGKLCRHWVTSVPKSCAGECSRAGQLEDGGGKESAPCRGPAWSALPSSALCPIRNQQTWVSSQLLSQPSSHMSTRVPGAGLKVHSTAALLLAAQQEPCPSCRHGSAQLQTAPLHMCRSIFPGSIPGLPRIWLCEQSETVGLACASHRAAHISCSRVYLKITFLILDLIVNQMQFN